MGSQRALALSSGSEVAIAAPASANDPQVASTCPSDMNCANDSASAQQAREDAARQDTHVDATSDAEVIWELVSLLVNQVTGDVVAKQSSHPADDLQRWINSMSSSAPIVKVMPRRDADPSENVKEQEQTTSGE